MGGKTKRKPKNDEMNSVADSRFESVAESHPQSQQDFDDDAISEEVSDEHTDASSLTSPTFQTDYQTVGKAATGLADHLHQLLDMREWQDALRLLRSNRAGVPPKDIVCVPIRNRGGEVPLHNVCDWDYYPENEREGQDDGKSRKNKDKKKKRTSQLRKEMAEELIPPPLALIKLICESYPRAARIRGKDGCLPIHYAARGSAPREVLEILIRAFPQALNVPDDMDQTPRDFYQESEESQSCLDRPTSCWVQQVADDDNRDQVEVDIRALEEEVSKLTAELATEEDLEKRLEQRLKLMEKDIEKFGTMVHGSQLKQQLKEVEDELNTEVAAMEEQLALAETKLVSRHKPAELDREYIHKFNEDIRKIYVNVEHTKESVRRDLVELRSRCAKSAQRGV